MPWIPREKAVDSTLALLREGYRFISNRCRRHGADAFETRLMLQRAIFVQGEDAARMFYVPGRFSRKGALPLTTLKLLQDKGSVALMDGDAHRRRKAMFMSLMTPAALARHADLLEAEWHVALERWEGMQQVRLLGEVQAILCRAVCRWAGVPLEAGEVPAVTRELVAMVEGAGSVGPRNWRGMRLRAQAERRIREVVRRTWAGELEPPPGSALEVIARHRGLDGQPLDLDAAAVELLNVLRPTVAVAWFVTFAALALHQHPIWRARILAGEDGDRHLFVQEVRRFYPFFPLVAGRAREAFTWRGQELAAGTWVILDLYGTDHDPRIWGDPENFRPERFEGWNGSPYSFIPQGGGGFHTGHRCPGEWLTIALLERAVELLASAMRYEVPPQDLEVDLGRMPAEPRSRFVVEKVRRLSPGELR